MHKCQISKEHDEREREQDGKRIWKEDVERRVATRKAKVS
jgi:hypothetical protein